MVHRTGHEICRDFGCGPLLILNHRGSRMRKIRYSAPSALKRPLLALTWEDYIENNLEPDETISENRTIRLHKSGYTTGRYPDYGSDMKFISQEKRLQISVFTQPICLGGEVTVNNVTFLILETPRRDDEDIPLPDPDPLFYLSLDSAHAGNPVIAPHPDMVCTHHKICKSELFIGPFLWEPDSYNRRSIFIYCVWIEIIIITIIPNSCNSVDIMNGV